MHVRFLGANNELRTRKVCQRFIWIAAVIAACLCPMVVFGQTQVTDNWTAVGSGAWSNSADWSSGVPNNNPSTSYNVVINSGSSTSQTVVTLNTSPTINNLSLGSYDLLQLGTNSETLTIAGSSISGNILANPSSTLQLVISGTGVISSAALTLSNTSSISASISGNTLVNQGSIQGGGTIGGGGLAFTNSGSILANASGGLTVTITGTNSGAYYATGQSDLQVNNGGVIQNADIEAYLQQGNNQQGNPNVEISGGTINNSYIAGSAFDNVWNGIVSIQDATINNSTFDTAGAQPHGTGTVVLNGDIINNGTFIQGNEGDAAIGISCGTITVNGGSNSTTLEGGQITIAGGFSNNGTLTQSAIIIDEPNANLTASSGTLVSYSSISASTPGEVLTNPGLIEGSTIGNGGLVVVNSGTIKGGELHDIFMPATLDVQNVTDTNTGTIEAAIIGTGTAVVNNSGGLIENSEIENVVINGGTISGTGGLDSATINNASFKGGGTLGSTGSTTISGGSSATTLQVANGSSLTLAGAFTNTGKIELEASGSATQLLISGNITLSGTISLSNDSNNVIQGAATGMEVLTNKGTIEGAGNIGNGFMGLVNSGTIVANQNTPLTIDPSTAGFSNTGKLTVNGGSTLNIAGLANSFTDTGTVKVLSGGTLAMGTNLNYAQTKGTTTVDGTLSVARLNSINIQGGTLYGNNGTLDGNFSLSATGVVNPGDGAKKIGDLTIDGTYTQGLKSSLTIDIGGTTADTAYSVLNVTDAASLSGKLVVDLVSGFTPTVGESFDILNYGSETGTFSITTLPKLAGGDTWSISYNATDLVLTVDGPAATQGAVSASPAKRVSRGLVASTPASTHEPAAILSRGTCFTARLLALTSCGAELIASSANRGDHQLASVGAGSGTVHNNVMVATRSLSAARNGASHESSASATAMARLYACAYLPFSVAHTMGCY